MSVKGHLTKHIGFSPVFHRSHKNVQQIGYQTTRLDESFQMVYRFSIYVENSLSRATFFQSEPFVSVKKRVHALR